MPDNIEQLREDTGARPEDQNPAVPETIEGQSGADPVANNKQEEINPLSLSDDDFLKGAPVSVASGTPSEAPNSEPDNKAAPEITEDGEENKDTPLGSEPKADAAEEPGKNEVPARPDVEALNTFYDRVMAPMKANGKEIQLKSPEEAIQLMQMGANYTRKLQELAPHRKAVAMLQNNNISEERLSFLIDLDKKDPEAIKKLIMDSGIDPLDIDTKIEPAYREGSHRVSDEEVAFTTQIEELGSSEEGKATLLEIDANWDQASKDMLWQHPDVMSVIHTQRELGVYDKITTEMARQKTLGKLSPTTPFLDAYRSVGDQLHAAGAFEKPGEKTEEAKPDTGDQNPGTAAEIVRANEPAPKPVPEVIVTRAATPKPTVDNSDRAGAAASTRSVPGKAKEAVNFLSMSDEEFMKAHSFQGRL